MSFLDEMLNTIRIKPLESDSSKVPVFDFAHEELMDEIQDEVYRAFGIPKNGTTISVKDNVEFDEWMMSRVCEGINKLSDYVNPMDPRSTKIILRLTPANIFVEFIGVSKVDKFSSTNIKRVQGVRNEGICFQIKVPQINSMALSNAFSA